MSVAVCLLATACSAGSECKTFAAAGLSVSVVDVSGKPVCDAEVTATDGSFSEVLRSSSPDAQPCLYIGVFERIGTYTLTATATGQRGVMNNLRVSKDACHVKTLTPIITIGPVAP
jgi:hypothetical protein